MVWVKLDDGFALHPKVIALSDLAFRCHISAMCWSGRYLTDGFIPSAVAPAEPVAELVASGLWESRVSGWQIHDWHLYQPSRQEVEQALEQKRSAGRAGGIAAAKARALAKSKPGPGPVPEPRPKNQKALAPAARKYPHDFELFWAIYPRKDDKADAFKAWPAAKRKASQLEIEAGAERYSGDPNRDPAFTKLAATWLHHESWNNGPLPPRGGSNGQGERAQILARLQEDPP